MYTPYVERFCQYCPLKGKVFEPVKIMDTDITYVECLRDNEGAKEAFIRANKDEKLLWIRQEVKLLHCIYAYSDGSLPEQLR